MKLLKTIITDDANSHKPTPVSDLSTDIGYITTEVPVTDLKSIEFFPASVDSSKWKDDAKAWKVKILKGHQPVQAAAIKQTSYSGPDSLYDVGMTVDYTSQPGFILLNLIAPNNIANPIPAGSSVTFDICTHNQFGIEIGSVKFKFN